MKAIKLIGMILVVLVTTTFPTSCSDEYDDSLLTNRVDDLENRVSKLEELCSQMNTNIGSLQTLINALQDRDYITNVTPITKEDKTIGYTITFAKSSPITIYHGKDGENGKNGEDGKDGVNGTDGKDGENGKDGVDGKDGSTPIIGVKKHTDGIYYWTVNNEWLLDDNGKKIKAEGTDGKDGSDGSNGSNGSNGTNGTNGNDGITPKLKIEDDYWFVSYDNGSNWTKLGKATGEDGENGTNGTNGDSFFQSVDNTSSNDYVVFKLSNGTEIKLPTWAAYEKLEILCNKMNTNITSLQTIVKALQNNDYIDNITPLMENGVEIGYTITFTKSNPITIYHGKNGENGTNGNTPVISVEKDADNIYYWTVDGEWLLDDNGDKIKAEGTDGTNGSNGTNGTNGNDGITPKLKIEDDYWFVSYDNGSNWTKLDKATGEDGENGTNGTNGDSFFQSVTQDENYVYFKLADGTIITISKNAPSTPKPTDFIQFEDVNVKALCLKWDTNYDGELSYEEAANVNSLGTTFKGNTTIRLFKELQYFTGLTSLSSAFSGCTGLTYVNIPSNVTNIYNAFSECNSLIYISIPNNIKTIGESAFVHCYSLKTVIIPNSVSSIGKSAFNNCESLESIDIPSSVTTIGVYAFASCKSLTSITLPYGVETLEQGAFDGCTSLASINIANSLKTIGLYAFEDCTSLITITLPNSVETIEKGAFNNCSALKEIYCKATTPPTIDNSTSITFDNGTNLKKIYVPIDNVNIYKTNWSRYSYYIEGYNFTE